MDKYLFTDGITGIKEVHSREELEALAGASSQPEKIRIWEFSSHEWINYAVFSKNSTNYPGKDLVLAKATDGESTRQNNPGKKWLKKFLYLSVVIATAFLVFNFTKIKWENAGTQYIYATRPANMPVMDLDSLIWVIEEQRGQKLDRSTRTNLRLRNSWPDRVLLQLTATKEISKNDGARFSGVQVSIDNTTGFNLDNAIVKLAVWKDNKINTTDTFRFNNIGYAKLASRELVKTYRGDSIAVSFQSIRARSFNFCYSSATKNEYGDHYDKWFCKE